MNCLLRQETEVQLAQIGEAVASHVSFEARETREQRLDLSMAYTLESVREADSGSSFRLPSRHARSGLVGQPSVE